MPTAAANPFDARAILDGIREWVELDEEIGGPTSRALIEAEGSNAKHVLVTEPARDGSKIGDNKIGGGKIVTCGGLGVGGEAADAHDQRLSISAIEPRARLPRRLHQTLR
jgi:hypothetical protein